MLICCVVILPHLHQLDHKDGKVLKAARGNGDRNTLKKQQIMILTLIDDIVKEGV